MFEIWHEGYQITGQRSDAVSLGNWPGETFKEAVEKWAENLCPEHRELYDADRMTFWGCRLFDNEKEARQAFG